MRYLATLLVLCAACSNEPTVGDGPLERYPADIWPDARLELEELGRIQGDEIDRVDDLLVAADGAVVLVQGGEPSLRFYGPDGAARGAAGREGEGPGEFLRLGSVGWAADSVWVYDNRQGRYSVFGPERSFQRVQRVELRPSWAPHGLSIRHVYPGDTLLVTTGNAALGSTERRYALATSDGTLVREIAAHEEGRHMVTIGEPDAPVRGQVGAPFRASVVSDVSADGSRLAIARPFMEEPIAGAVAVTVLDPQGDTVFAHAAETELVEVDREAQERILQSGERRFPGSAEQLRAQGLPRHYPPIEAVLVGRDGSTWLQMRSTEEGKPYRVRAPDGTPVGTLVIPEEHRVLEAELDEVWILEEDELDVESIARYRVR